MENTILIFINIVPVTSIPIKLLSGLAIAFSKPFKSYGYKNFAAKQVYRGFWGRFDQNRNFAEMAGTQVRAYFDFDTKEGEQIKLKVALSPVSTEGALLNMSTEIPHW